MSEFTFYVGIDLGNTQQAICVLDRGRNRVLQRTADTDHAVLRVVEAVGETPFEQVAVGVEDLNNVVVDGLLDLGFSVFSINPKQADRFRDRMSAAGAKDDRRDAQVLARALMTDLEFFHRRAPRTELELAMRVSRRREASMAEEVRRLSSQLYAMVQRLDPSLLRLCQGADERWFWSLVLAVLAKPKAPNAQHLETMLRKEGKRKLGELVPTVMAIVDDNKRTRATAKLTALMLPEVRTTVAALRTLETERSKAMSDLTALVESERRRSVSSAADVPGALLQARVRFVPSSGVTLTCQSGGRASASQGALLVFSAVPPPPAPCCITIRASFIAPKDLGRFSVFEFDVDAADASQRALGFRTAREQVPVIVAAGPTGSRPDVRVRGDNNTKAWAKNMTTEERLVSVPARTS